MHTLAALTFVAVAHAANAAARLRVDTGHRDEPSAAGAPRAPLAQFAPRGAPTDQRLPPSCAASNPAGSSSPTVQRRGESGASQ